MKKKLITSIIAAAMLAAGTMTAHAATDTTLSNVTVYDQTTPAVFAAGRDWPITTWYFYSQSGEVLGSVPNSTVMQIAKTDGTDDVDWEVWLAEAFNDYRDGGSKTTASEPTPEPPKAAPEKPEKENAESVTPIAPTEQKPDFDAESLSLEVIELTNAQREKHGLHPLEADDDLMELAMTRAEEVSRKYSHERPDGTRVVQMGYGENCGAKASPEKQVDSWMNSEGHRTNILIDWYESIGVGCYKAESGRTYWVQIFSR